MPHWEDVIIHHSATGDTTLPDSVAIRRFHTSYRHGGDIITKDKYDELKSSGTSGLVEPWQDIGYHWLVEELSDGRPWVIRGRSMMLSGAHCYQSGMNHKGIGLCVVGNFDPAPPKEATMQLTAEFVAWLCRMYNIPIEKVRPHREYAT